MELPALQRRNVVEDLLDLQVFSAMNNILKERITTNKDELNSIEQTIRLVTSNLELHENHLKEIKTDIKVRTTELKTKLKEQMDEIQHTQGLIDTTVTKLDAFKVRLATEFDPLIEKRKKCRDYYVKASKVIGKYESQIEFYRNSCKCPTCSQEISQNTKDQEITERETKISDLKTKMDKAEATAIVLDKKLEDMYQVEEDMEWVKNGLNSLKLDLASAKTLKRSYEIDLAGLKEKYEQVDTTLQEDFQKQVATANERKAVILDEREVLSIASTLLKDGGIKTLIIKQYIPIMNKIIKQYLGQMNLFVDFNLDENFEEVIGGINNETNSYYSHSEGEKKRINLAIMFAWRNIARIRQSANSNILIFDEILDSSLDQDGRDDFMNVLNAMIDTNIIIISHNTDTITDRFDNILKFEKKKAFSQLSETI
jgi:DNA repair exonuclease SbcCD ATPase subunit